MSSAITPSEKPRKLGRKWIWVATFGLGIILLAIVANIFGRILAVFELYWSPTNIQRLFYEEFGLSKSWSAFIGVVGSFFYALAWVPLSLWTYRVLVWRFNPHQFALAFLCWVFVYGHVPLLHALLGSDTCFNQRTGEPTKWYVQDADGRIVLFDSSGFDTATGSEKHPVTSQMCMAFARQKANDRPRRMTADVRRLEFFDPATGRPRVWYSRTADGNFELFDSRGYHPVTSEALLPMTKEAVAEMMKRLADEEAARKRVEEERKRADEVAGRKRAEQEIPAKKIEEEAARKKAAEEAARRKAEEEAEQKRAEVRSSDEANSFYYVANTQPPDAFLALRTHPTARQGKRIMTMPNGTYLKVLQRRSDGWWFVQVVPSGPEGWALSGQGNKEWIECCATAAISSNRN